MGVKQYKIILAKNPFPTLTAKLTPESYSKKGLQILDGKMRVAEALHFIAFLLSLIIMIVFAFLRDFSFLYFMLIFNILNNLYPFFVQRYNRNRILNILNDNKLTR